MTTPTPSQMPRKANLLFQQVLSKLIETKPVSWNLKTLVPATSISKETVNKTRITGVELVNGLARNVSDDNVNRAAKRWIR